MVTWKLLTQCNIPRRREEQRRRAESEFIMGIILTGIPKGGDLSVFCQSATQTSTHKLMGERSWRGGLCGVDLYKIL